ncbi:MAG: hypothetical protein JO068_18220 [Hyphomicrobiales bacterium]|nr:hypothetical protein [Hyphomicrobiales bacterium]
MNVALNVASPPTLEARYSPQKAFRLLSGSAAGMVPPAVLILLPIRWSRGNPTFLLYLLLLLLGGCAVVAIRRLVTVGRPVLTITAEGIFDKRIASRIIPWRMVRGISTGEQKSKTGKTIITCVVLTVGEADEGQLALTRWTRLTRGLNHRLGADGLVIRLEGLDVDYDQVFTAITTHVEAARKAWSSVGACALGVTKF